MTLHPLDAYLGTLERRSALCTREQDELRGRNVTRVQSMKTPRPRFELGLQARQARVLGHYTIEAR